MPSVLFLVASILALAHVVLCDLSVRWAFNIPQAAVLERIDVSADKSFVVASVQFPMQQPFTSASLYAFAADPGNPSGSLLWTIQAHTENAPLGRPSISPDGKYVAVGCQTCQINNAFIFAISGNSPSLLWSGLLKQFGSSSPLQIEGIPAWRPDSSFVYFQDVSYGNVVEVQVSGSPSVTGQAVVSKGPSNPGAPSAVVSQDGKYLYACGTSGVPNSGALNQYTLPMMSQNPSPSAKIQLSNPCAATPTLQPSTNMLYIGDNNGTAAIDTSGGRLARKWCVTPPLSLSVSHTLILR